MEIMEAEGRKKTSWSQGSHMPKVGWCKAWLFILPDGDSSAFWLWQNHNRCCQFKGRQESQFEVELTEMSQSSVSWCQPRTGVSRRGAARTLSKESTALLFGAAQKEIGKQLRGVQRQSRKVSLRERNHSVSFWNGCFVLPDSNPDVQSTESQKNY